MMGFTFGGFCGGCCFSRICVGVKVLLNVCGWVLSLVAFLGDAGGMGWQEVRGL